MTKLVAKNKTLYQFTEDWSRPYRARRVDVLWRHHAVGETTKQRFRPAKNSHNA